MGRGYTATDQGANRWQRSNTIATAWKRILRSQKPATALKAPMSSFCFFFWSLDGRWKGFFLHRDRVDATHEVGFGYAGEEKA